MEAKKVTEEEEETWRREIVTSVMRLVSTKLPQTDLISLLLVSPWLYRTLVSYPSIWLGISGGSGVGCGGGGGGIPSFSEFSFADLKAATNNFSSDNLVSESGEKAPNLVYKGRLQNRRWFAVKKFTKMAWPEPKQFATTYL